LPVLIKPYHRIEEKESESYQQISSVYLWRNFLFAKVPVAAALIFFSYWFHPYLFYVSFFLPFYFYCFIYFYILYFLFFFYFFFIFCIRFYFFYFSFFLSFYFY